jgi:uncharacterized protein (DUF2132 family)
MNDEINYKNNPLHGVSLKKMLTEVVDHYGFEILFAYLKINCFRTNPSIASSVKFLKKTDWAREKVENFYLYQFKSLPRAAYDQFQLSPRDRIIPDGQVAGEPAELSLEDAELLQKKRTKKSASYEQVAKKCPGSGERVESQRERNSDRGGENRSRGKEHKSSDSPASSSGEGFNPWEKSKKS